MPSVKAKGVEAIIKALRRKRKEHAKGMQVGLKKAGLFLQRESQKIVPIDTGALRNSANTRAEGEGLSTVVYVTYGMDYAIYVHEDLQAAHAPGKQAKYLEQPAREKRAEMREIVRKEIDK